MHSITLLALLGTALVGQTVASSDPIYDGAVNDHFLPAGFMLDRFESMGFTVNRTAQDDEGNDVDIFYFDLDQHNQLEDTMINDVIAAGPQNQTDAGSETSTERMARSLAVRTGGDQDSYACKVSESYIYSFSLTNAVGAACSLIFEGSTRAAVAYARYRNVPDVTGRNLQVTIKFVYYVGLFGSNNACTTLMSMIVNEGCMVSHLSDNTVKCSG